MDVNKLIPLIRYQRLRVPNMTDTQWTEKLKKNQVEHLFAIAFRHDLSQGGERYAMGGAVMTPYRDFCGGYMVESGYADLDMSPMHGYTGYRILGGNMQDEYSTLPHINDLVADPPTTYNDLLELLEKSVAGAVISQCMSAGRSILHFMDKEGGKLSEIMKHIKSAGELTCVPNSVVTTGSGRLQPWINQTMDAADRPRVTNFTEAHVEFKKVGIDWHETPSYLNTNSGNDCFGVTIHLERDAHVPGRDEPITQYCDTCDDTYEYDGFTDCPDCANEIFDPELSGRTTEGRPAVSMAAIRHAYGQPGAWKFMPFHIWRCG